MEEPLRCVEAFPVRELGETSVRRCQGKLVPSEEEPDSYVCTRNHKDHDPITCSGPVMDAMRVSPLWHRTIAIQRMLAVLTNRNIAAYDSTYPWIQIPLGARTRAVASTMSGFWNVDFLENNAPTETQVTDIAAASEDTELIARALHQKLLPHIS